MHSRHLFCKSAVVLVSLLSPFVSAGEARNPLALGQEFEIHVEAQSRRDPVPKSVLIPVTAGSFLARDWYVYKFQGKPCHIPTGSVLTVSLLSKSRMIGTLQWPYNYKMEGYQCADRQAPNEGVCYNSKAPQMPLCFNGAEVIVDWSEALDEKGQPLDPMVIAEKIKAALAPPKID